jgi:rhodanese-related sulfurtransferase
MSISVDQVFEKISKHENFQIVDVRTSGEYNSGHIKHSVLIPLDTI